MSKSKQEKQEKVYPDPVVTTSSRKKHPGFVNPNKGIEVAPGLTIQDVPRGLIQQHLRQTEHFWKSRFKAQYGHTHGGQESF